MAIKKRVHEILERGQDGDRASKTFDTVLVVLVALRSRGGAPR